MNLILHADLDSFFASVEARDNPQYKSQPLIIGADPKGGKGRGVVSTCCYNARKYGIHSAMPISQAYRLCPQGIYLRPNHSKYFEESKKVMEILENLANKFQQVSIDEAYLDVSEQCESIYEAGQLARKIQKEVFEKIGITVSIGVSTSKSIAKIASDYNKPNGITIVKPDNIKIFLKDMDITAIPSIGKKTKTYYYKKGIKNIGDFYRFSRRKMDKLFGKTGKWVWKVIHGEDRREVKEFSDDRKSISKERTFYEDTGDYNQILSKLGEINDLIDKKIKKHNISYKTITLKIRFEGFETYTRSKSLPVYIQDKERVMEIVIELMEEFSKSDKKVRLVGIKLSNLRKDPETIQTSILEYIQK